MEKDILIVDPGIGYYRHWSPSFKDRIEQRPYFDLANRFLMSEGSRIALVITEISIEPPRNTTLEQFIELVRNPQQFNGHEYIPVIGCTNSEYDPLDEKIIRLGLDVLLPKHENQMKRLEKEVEILLSDPRRYSTGRIIIPKNRNIRPKSFRTVRPYIN